MQHLEVSGAVRLIYKSLGVKGLKLIAFTLQQWLHECVSLLCYTYSVCLCFVLQKVFNLDFWGNSPNKINNFGPFVSLFEKKKDLVMGTY